jgi:hypothetical protein
MAEAGRTAPAGIRKPASPGDFMKKFVSALALISLACVAASAQTRKNSTNDKSLPSEHIIDRIEPVAHFYDAIPTGVTVSSKGRIFVNFPRWGDQVPFTVAELARRQGRCLSGCYDQCL